MSLDKNLKTIDQTRKMEIRNAEDVDTTATQYEENNAQYRKKNVGTSTTTKIVYLCEKVKGFFLSKTALDKLDTIQPILSESKNTSQINSTKSHDSPTADCGCPLR